MRLGPEGLFLRTKSPSGYIALAPLLRLSYKTGARAGGVWSKVCRRQWARDRGIEARSGDASSCRRKDVSRSRSLSEVDQDEEREGGPARCVWSRRQLGREGARKDVAEPQIPS